MEMSDQRKVIYLDEAMEGRFAKDINVPIMDALARAVGRRT